MLMTVLKGELAITQNKMLIRTFKEMKHFKKRQPQEELAFIVTF